MPSLNLELYNNGMLFMYTWFPPHIAPNVPSIDLECVSGRQLCDNAKMKEKINFQSPLRHSFCFPMCPLGWSCLTDESSSKKRWEGKGRETRLQSSKQC